MTDNKAALEGKFERWFYTARDPVKDMPYGTHLLYRVCDNDKDKFEIGCELLMAAFVGGHEAALAATQPREPEPKACPACKGEPESGFIEMVNNGPIVPCRTCNSDPESCADVPSLRHCEAANRETATQPPQVAEDYTEDKDVFEYLREKQALGYFTHPAIVKLMWMAQPPQATDAQRQAALDILNKVEYYVLKHDPRSGIKDPCDKAMLNRAQIDTIKAALQSPAVPREVVEKLRQIAQGTGTRDGQFQRSLIMSKETMRELASECPALLGGKESQ